MNTERFFYLRKFSKQPIGVMALRKENDSEVRVAASLCNPTDRWDPKLGVLRAKGRLNSEKHSVLVTILCGLDVFVVDGKSVTLCDILDKLMPPFQLHAPAWQRYGVETGYMAQVLKHQIQRMLEGPKR